MAKGHFPKAYLRMDPNIDMHPDFEGMVMLMCAANRQHPRGRFNREFVQRLVGRKRLAEFLSVRAGKTKPDMVELPDGLLYLEGWDEWQEGDWTVGERVARLRAKRNGTVTSTVTPPLPDRKSPPLALGVGREALGVGQTDESPAVGTHSSSGRVREGVRVTADEDSYVTAVLTLYSRVPGTRGSPTKGDRKLALDLCRAGTPLAQVRAGMLKATVHREGRAREVPLEPINSLHYFRDEIAAAADYDPEYLEHLVFRGEAFLKPLGEAEERQAG